MKGRLKFILLKALEENPGSSGASLSRLIGDKIGREPSPGSLYPLLRNLDDKGVVKCEEKGKQKLYSLTEEGKESVQGLEQCKKDMLDKFIRGMKAYDYLFEEEEMEGIIEHMQMMKKDPEQFPDYLLQGMNLFDYLKQHEDDLPQDKVIQILQEAEAKAREVVESE